MKCKTGDTLEELTPEQIDILNEVGKNIIEYRENNAIKPAHYRKGLDDMMEGWYRTQPWNEWRTSMVNIAERYFRRDKDDPVEDIDKGIYVMERVKQKEMERNGI